MVKLPKMMLRVLGWLLRALLPELNAMPRFLRKRLPKEGIVRLIRLDPKNLQSRTAPDSDRAPSTRPSRPPSTPSGRSPRRWMALAEENRAARPAPRASHPPRHHRPSARASVWAPTPRLSC